MTRRPTPRGAAMCAAIPLAIALWAGLLIWLQG